MPPPGMYPPAPPPAAPAAARNPLFGRASLSNIMSNPLFGAGIGLLTQGPSLVPQNPLAGLGAGLMMSSRAQQLQAEQERAAAQLQMRQDELAMKREQAEQERAAAAARSRATVQALIGRKMDPQQARALEAAGAGREYLKPPPPDPLARLRAMAAAPPEERAALESAAESLRGPGVQVYQAPPPLLRATPGGGTAQLVPSGPGGRLVPETVIPGREPGETAIATATAKEVRAESKFQEAASNYMDAVNAWRADRLNMDLKTTAEAEREKVIEALAQRESPGRAPTDDDRRAAELRTPDFIGGRQALGALLGSDPFDATMRTLMATPPASVPGAAPGAPTGLKPWERAAQERSR